MPLVSSAVPGFSVCPIKLIRLAHSCLHDLSAPSVNFLAEWWTSVSQADDVSLLEGLLPHHRRELSKSMFTLVVKKVAICERKYSLPYSSSQNPALDFYLGTQICQAFHHPPFSSTYGAWLWYEASLQIPNYCLIIICCDEKLLGRLRACFCILCKEPSPSRGIPPPSASHLG